MMNTTTDGRVRLGAAEAQRLGEAAMRGAGYDQDDARIITDHVVDAALCGYEYSGLPKLLNVVDSPKFRLPRRPITLTRDAGATALLDGGNQVGMVTAYHAAKLAIERGQAHGLAVISLANTWTTGRSAYFCEMIAKAGLIVMHSVAIEPGVAPFGGARPALGTNPIAFGFPTQGEPLVIDIGTSAFMASNLQYRARVGMPIPAGVALGPKGDPTTDAGEALLGTLLPFGGPESGYKGFGLALAMDALGALTAGARPAGALDGHIFIAIKPDAFLPLDDYRREISQRIATIKATPRQEGVDEIRMPGERSHQTRARLLQDGIEIDVKIHSALERLAAGRLDHGG
jgi:LDH2 family malate/lactate/ureidoglycolate dehydrogenase